MMAETGHSITGTPARSVEEELDDKGRDQRNLRERVGTKDDGSSNHPATKRTGRKDHSNVGEDETSGSE